VWKVWVPCRSCHELIITRSVPMARNKPHEIASLNEKRQKIFFVNLNNVFLLFCCANFRQRLYHLRLFIRYLLVDDQNNCNTTRLKRFHMICTL
jgi:hypothetical protein